jgi:hypothetical protein
LGQELATIKDGISNDRLKDTQSQKIAKPEALNGNWQPKRTFLRQLFSVLGNMSDVPPLIVYSEIGQGNIDNNCPRWS